MTDEKRTEVIDIFISIGEKLLKGNKHFHLEPILARDTIQAIKELKKENAELKEFAEKLSEQHADEWQKQQEVITELKEKIEKMKKNCLDVMRVQGINLSDDYMAGMYNGMVVIYNSCFLDTVNELEKSYCSKNENGKWEKAK